MSESSQQTVSRPVAFATLGTFVVTTIVFAATCLRTATDEAALDVPTPPFRKHATVFNWPEPRSIATGEVDPVVLQTTATAPVDQADETGPTLGAPIAPYPMTAALPAPAQAKTARSSPLTLPAFPSTPPDTIAEPLPPIVVDEPAANPPVASIVAGPAPAWKPPVAQPPVAQPPLAQPPLAHPSTTEPPATVQQHAPTPNDLPVASPEPPAAAPLTESSPSNLPPSPWSRFVASFGAGHFTEQGTISLSDVRVMALRNNKDIAVLGNLPQIAGATAGLEEAIFDPVFTINPIGGRYNRQVATEVQSLNADSNVLKTGFLLPGSSLNQVYVEKLFTTGGRIQVGVGQNLQQYSPAGDFVLVNPAWQSSVNMIVDQPLFRGRGPNWNEAPLRIARANQLQSQHAFQATVNQVLRDAETAYWDAYAAYQDFEVRRMAAAQALETVERERGRLRLGEGSVPDVAQAEEQAEAFQIGQAEAENRLIDAQRTLRRLMGLAPDDPRPIIPATAASDAPVVVGREDAAAQALNRPEIGAQQAIVEAAEVEVCRRRNGLLPDISVRAIYSVTGLDNHWDEAWSTVGTAGYNDWTVGAVYKQPLGRRADNSLAQRAAATLSLESAKLRQLEHEILHQLDSACQNVAAAERLLSMHRRRREAAAVQLEARRELYLENRAQLRDELDAEARYASAVLDESIARVNYQRALTDWNYARGSISSEDVVVAP